MRQLLEPQSRWRSAGIGVIGNQIAAADFDRIHADFCSREIDQAFRHRAGNGMADGAILTHDVLVLEHDAGPGAIILRHIRAADEVDDLVRLDGAGARIHRIRTDAGQIVDLERRDRAITLDADPALAAMIAGMNIGVETFDPVGDEFDRPAQQFRQRIGRHLVGIDVDLDAEGTTDVLADHANLRLHQSQMEGRNVLHHVRRLRALIDRQPRFGDVPVRHHRARLQCHAGMPAKDELRFHHLVGAGKRRIDGAGVVVALESEVVAERRMDHRGFRIERGAHVRHRLQLLVFHRDEFRGILGYRAAGRHDGRDGLTLPADAINRDRMLRRRLQTLQMRQHADPRRDDRRKLFAGHDGDNARQALRRRSHRSRRFSHAHAASAGTPHGPCAAVPCR